MKISFPFHGMPSLTGTTSLASALAQVEQAEAALSAARSAARAAARRAGRSTRHLFDGHPFVARASAERWCDEARREGEQAMANIFSRNLDTEAGNSSSPFQHLAARLLRSGAGGMREQREAMLTLLSTGTAPGSLADKILAAAARARSTGADERPAPTGKAAEILAAGEKARRPTGDE